MFYVLHFFILFFKMATQLLLFGWDNKKYLTFFCEKKYINKGKNYHLKKKNLKRGPLNKKRVRTLNKFLFLFGIIPIGCTQNLKILPSIWLHLKNKNKKHVVQFCHGIAMTTGQCWFSRAADTCKSVRKRPCFCNLALKAKWSSHNEG